MFLMKMCLPSKKYFVGVLSILIVISILATVVPAAYAEGTGPLSPIVGLGRPSNDTLIRMHKLEGSWFNDQDALLKKANQLSVSFQALIDAESKAGKVVTSLQDAESVFDSEVIASTQIHAEAGAIIYSLVGWNGAGDVRDRAAAGQSLLDGRDKLKDANFRLTYAMDTLQKSFVSWRSHRINKDGAWIRSTAAPTATP
jgi:hypothetical protein